MMSRTSNTSVNGVMLISVITSSDATIDTACPSLRVKCRVMFWRFFPVGPISPNDGACSQRCELRTARSSCRHFSVVTTGVMDARKPHSSVDGIGVDGLRCRRPGCSSSKSRRYTCSNVSSMTVVEHSPRRLASCRSRYGACAECRWRFRLRTSEPHSDDRLSQLPAFKVPTNGSDVVRRRAHPRVAVLRAIESRIKGAKVVK